jgi:hypothetical protein
MSTREIEVSSPRRGTRPPAVADGICEDGRRLLTMLCEQAAIPLDQIARLMQRQLEETVRLLGKLEDAGCIAHRRFLFRDHPWFWPTRGGLRLLRCPYGYQLPDVALLSHRRAVNEIRLHLRDRAPAGHWICERTVARRREPGDHLPDAVFEIEGERHAIEAELSPKRRDELHRIILRHSDRYDAVIYFCNRRTSSLLRSVQAEGRWPKLLVRPLPEASQC